jgi:hypothetical protein
MGAIVPFVIVGGGATVAAWILRKRILGRAIAGLSSAFAAFVGGLAFATRFIWGEVRGDMLGVLVIGPIAALVGLALALKLTEEKDGSRAMVTAGAFAACAFFARFLG